MKIGSLHKITLALILENDDAAIPAKGPAMIEMIFGIGIGGLTPFELALEGKTVGDMLRMKVSANQADAFFGNLFQNLRMHLDLQLVPAEMSFLVEVKDVMQANNSEVVKALAQSGGHGCGGGSCDCGCG